MYLGERLRQLREAKNLSQGDIEKRTGLLRCYISRVENGHTVPSLETLEKLARAYEVHLYQVFYEGPEPAQSRSASVPANSLNDWASRGKGLALFVRLRRAVSRASANDRSLILHMAQKMSGQKRSGRAQGNGG